MKKIITKMYLALVTIGLAMGLTMRWYSIWSKIYSFLYIKKSIRNGVLPIVTRSSGGVSKLLHEVLKVPYQIDGIRELNDVCLPPGKVQHYIDHGLTGPMDCDDYARYIAARLDDTEYKPKLLSLIWANKENMKFGMFPKINGHVVCLYTCPEERIDPGSVVLPNIYHVGNWNRRIVNDKMTILDPKHFGYRNLLLLAQDTVGDHTPICWAIMDCELKVCTWGTGYPPDMCTLELESCRPMSLLG